MGQQDNASHAPRLRSCNCLVETSYMVKQLLLPYQLNPMLIDIRTIILLYIPEALDFNVELE